MDGSKRSTVWSITINNPEQNDYDSVSNKMGWKDFIRFEGQTEEGEKGTKHIQGMLVTKSVKFSAVKRQFPRAHIEIARNASALQKYVNKEDTRVSEIKKTKVATVVDLHGVLYDVLMVDDNKQIRCYVDDVDMVIKQFEKYNGNDSGMILLDKCVERLIDTDYYGIEYIGANPSVRATWKKYWKNILRREYRNAAPTSTQSVTQDLSQEEGSEDEHA